VASSSSASRECHQSNLTAAVQLEESLTFDAELQELTSASLRLVDVRVAENMNKAKRGTREARE